MELKSLELTEAESRVVAIKEENGGKISFGGIGCLLGISAWRARHIYREALKKLDISRRIEEAFSANDTLGAAKEELSYRVPRFRLLFLRVGSMRAILARRPEDLCGSSGVFNIGRATVRQIDDVLAQGNYKLRLGMTEAELEGRRL